MPLALQDMVLHRPKVFHQLHNGLQVLRGSNELAWSGPWMVLLTHTVCVLLHAKIVLPRFLVQSALYVVAKAVGC